MKNVRNEKAAVAEPKKFEMVAPKYRYFCPACTGVGFITSDRDSKALPQCCNACGSALGQIKPENFIPLS